LPAFFSPRAFFSRHIFASQGAYREAGRPRRLREVDLSRVLGGALAGVDGVPVEVEVRLSAQLPRVDIVGLHAI